MNDPIVQEVRDIRAAIAVQLGFDRARIIVQARELTAARRSAIATPATKPGKSSKARKPRMPVCVSA